MKGLTQEELADRAELTKGFISQVERNHTSPSIATLMDILQCLGTDLKNFFEEDEDNQIVFSNEDYFEKEDKELKNMIQWIVPNAQKNLMEPILVTLEAGGSTYPDNPHEGEEFGYVLSGTIKVVLGSKTYKVKKVKLFIMRQNISTILNQTRAQRCYGLVAPKFLKQFRRKLWKRRLLN